jgi:hypothetical protein
MTTFSLNVLSTNIKHKTISAYYHQVCTLPAFFGSDHLLQASDPRAYVDFVTGTLCAVRERSLPPLPTPYVLSSETREERRSQQECVDWVMRDLAGRGKNVLVKVERVSSLKSQNS